MKSTTINTYLYNNFIYNPSAAHTQSRMNVPEYILWLTLHLYHFRIGALAKYRCERGYKMIGEALATCTDSGQWSGVIPECECE